MNADPISVPGCRGTSAQELVNKNGLQVLKVNVLPGGEIPLHRHTCAATMVIVYGRATALGKEQRQVVVGDVVQKAANEAHGFTDIDEAFSFISISDGSGIVHEDEWDLTYVGGVRLQQ